jgi:hypothetical protein
VRGDVIGSHGPCASIASERDDAGRSGRPRAAGYSCNFSRRRRLPVLVLNDAWRVRSRRAAHVRAGAMTSSDFAFPDFFDYPPYFTVQPTPETFRKQCELWKSLVLRCAPPRHGTSSIHRLFINHLTLVPIRPRWRGERRSLRTFSPVASLHPSPLAFNPGTPRLAPSARLRRRPLLSLTTDRRPPAPAPAPSSPLSLPAADTARITRCSSSTSTTSRCRCLIIQTSRCVLSHAGPHTTASAW